MDAELEGTALAFWPEGRFLLMPARDFAAAVEALPDDEEPHRLLRALGALLIDEGDDRASSDALRTILARPLLRLDDLLLLHATLALVEAAADAALRDRMRPQLRDAVSGAVAWLAERKLYPLMASLLDRGLGYLPRREAREWRAEVRTHAAGSARRAAADAPMRITMLGSIRFSDDTGELQPLRGLRLRAMLGLLVAARMIRTPLSAAEFCVIAAGTDAGDIELARKTAVMAAGRLREVIGTEAVITGEPMYALNLAHVSVDLLEAHRLIQEAREALRRRALMRAYPALRGALRITRGEVPFPGLYDEIFEAIRNDFEHALRTAVLDVARALLLESDPSSAGELLVPAHEGMPDDEEITELLRQTLAADGRSTEAEQLRLRATELLDPVGQR
jgi:tetratricopeptide (TPR) repeat protein